MKLPDKMRLLSRERELGVLLKLTDLDYQTKDVHCQIKGCSVLRESSNVIQIRLQKGVREPYRSPGVSATYMTSKLLKKNMQTQIFKLKTRSN